MMAIELTNQSPADPKNFWIFGQGISFSMSPTIHCAGFAYYELPHTYEIYQTKTVGELESIIKSPTFGGASVTMPHKLAVKTYCSEISEHAQIIGAINTLVIDETKNGRMFGENTDWMGLASLLKDKTPTLRSSFETGLVIGAGGASRAALYAMYKTGVKKIYLFNRTKSKAEEVVDDLKSYFKITALENLIGISAQDAPQIIISTIPADKTKVEMFPPVLFSQPDGICIDMSYKPRLTPLMQAKRNLASRTWTEISGLEVLLQQGFVQFELWTGRTAPKMEMRQALNNKEEAQAIELPDI